MTIPEATGVAANAPDLKAQEPVRVIQIGSYTAVLARNPPSLLVRHEQRSSIRHPSSGRSAEGAAPAA